jgi:transposase-like protein
VAKGRLAVVLEVLAGRQTVADACGRLGLSERRFYDLRDQALRAALAGLEPRPRGRPPRMSADARTTALEATVRELRLDLHAAQVREEIALALPQLHRRAGPGQRAARRPARGQATGGRRAAPGG